MSDAKHERAHRALEVPPPPSQDGPSPANPSRPEPRPRPGLRKRLASLLIDHSDPPTLVHAAATSCPFAGRGGAGASGASDARGAASNLAAAVGRKLWLDFYCPPNHIMAEVLAGTTSALAMIPEVVSFAFLARVPPALAIQTSAVMGIMTAFLGGRPGMVTGAAGAVATVSRYVVADGGAPYLFYAVMTMGVVQLLVLLLQGHRLIPLIPSSVMLGFCNGLAILIALAQVKSFKRANPKELEVCPSGPQSTIALEGGGAGGAGISEGAGPGAPGRRLKTAFDVFTTGGPWVGWQEALWMLSIVAVVIAFIVGLGRAKRRWKFLSAAPASLLALVIATAWEHAFVRPSGFQTQSIGDTAEMNGSFYGYSGSTCNLPPYSEVFPKIVGNAVTMAAIGLLETVLTARLLTELTMTPQVSSVAREVGAQGLANIVAGFTSGMGGCAMIGQTMVNYQSRGYLRLSAIVSALVLFLTLGVAYPAVNLVPLAGLVGVMWFVCFETFSWKSLGMVLATAARLVAVGWRRRPWARSAPNPPHRRSSAAAECQNDSSGRGPKEEEGKASGYSREPSRDASSTSKSGSAAVDIGGDGGIDEADGPGSTAAGFGYLAAAEPPAGRPGSAGIRAWWARLKRGLSKNTAIPVVDAAVVVAVTAVTLVTDLAIGVAVGVGIAALGHALDMGNRLHIREVRWEPPTQVLPDPDSSRRPAESPDRGATTSLAAGSAAVRPGAAPGQAGTENGGPGVSPGVSVAIAATAVAGPLTKVYVLDGLLFFGSAAAVPSLFTPADDPKHVVLDLGRCSVSDLSGLEALDKELGRWVALGVRVEVRNMDPRAVKMFLRARDTLEHLKQDLVVGA